jgi:hypothetical protein
MFVLIKWCALTINNFFMKYLNKHGYVEITKNITRLT